MTVLKKKQLSTTTATWWPYSSAQRWILCSPLSRFATNRPPLPFALKALRARWHIENTAFHQRVSYWNFNHVFHHTPNAVMAVLLLWSLVFNLLQLFVYRRLKRPRRPIDPTYTIRHIVEAMLRDIASLPHPIPWAELIDSS